MERGARSSEGEPIPDPHKPSWHCPTRRSVVFWLATLGAFTLLWTVWWAIDPDVIRENATLEHAQSVALFFSALLALSRVRLGRLRIDTYSALGLAVLCFSFLVRELEIGDTREARDRFDWIVRSPIVVMWLALGAFALWDVKTLWKQRDHLIRSQSAQLVFAAGVMYLCAMFFDTFGEERFFGVPAMLIEELFEFYAPVLLFGAAAVMPVSVRSPRPADGGRRVGAVTPPKRSSR